jgi:uncharacterized protein (DUF983 family)
MFKGSKLYSIFRFKCPRCHKGEFFETNPYNLKYSGNTHEKCSVCNQDYSPEPGFYFGAMYVGYALGVALFVTIWASCNLFFYNIDVWTQIGLVVGFSVVLTPLIYALSKIIWANFFIHYSDYAKQGRKETTHR